MNTTATNAFLHVLASVYATHIFKHQLPCSSTNCHSHTHTLPAPSKLTDISNLTKCESTALANVLAARLAKIRTDVNNSDSDDDDDSDDGWDD